MRESTTVKIMAGVALAALLIVTMNQSVEREMATCTNEMSMTLCWETVKDNPPTVRM